MPKEESLYEMLGLDKTASQADIKKAYYKLALQWHPDRNPDPKATARFQALQHMYGVLSDPVKRKLYDNTGSLQECEEMVQGDNFQDLYAAFREATKVTEEDMDSFAAKYRGSAEERADLLQLFARFRGNMGSVFDWLMLSRPDLDSHRFRDTLEEAIAAGAAKPTTAYKAWSSTVASTPRPRADPLALPKRSKGRGKQQPRGDDSLALVAAIKGKGGGAAFNGMLAALEAKYAGKGKGSSASGSGKAKAAADCSGKAKQASKATSKKLHKRHASSSGEEEEEEEEEAAAASSDCKNSEATEGDGDDVVPAAEPTEEEFSAARERLEQRLRQQQAAGTAAEAAMSGRAKGKQQKKQQMKQAAAVEPADAGGKQKRAGSAKRLRKA